MDSNIGKTPFMFCCMYEDKHTIPVMVAPNDVTNHAKHPYPRSSSLVAFTTGRMAKVMYPMMDMMRPVVRKESSSVSSRNAIVISNVKVRAR